MSDQPYQKPDLTRSYLIPEEHDFEIYTDGSGTYNDPFGGCAVWMCSHKYSKKSFIRATAFYGTNTERAELEGMLAGLQGILDIMEWNNPFNHKLLEARRATVFWLTDREALVGCVVRKASGDPVYRRKSSPDLWARFAFYETLFEVQAVHRPRATHPLQHHMDKIAGDCRAMMKKYVTTMQIDKKII